MPQEKDKTVLEDSLLVARPYKGKDQLEAELEDPEPKEGEGLEEEIPDDELNVEEQRYKKRYGDLRRHSQEQEAELQERIKELTAKAEAATPVWTPPKTDEELETFAKDNPEAYDILVSVADKRAQASADDVSKLRKELAENKRLSAQENARNVLITKHPDWDDIRDDDAFHDWADEQPKIIQDGIYANASDGALAARVLDLYKQDMGISGKKAKNVSDLKKDAAKLVNAKESKTDKASPKNTYTRSQLASMTIQEYEANEKDILAAQRDGRILNE